MAGLVEVQGQVPDLDGLLVQGLYPVSELGGVRQGGEGGEVQANLVSDQGAVVAALLLHLTDHYFQLFLTFYFSAFCFLSVFLFEFLFVCFCLESESLEGRVFLEGQGLSECF